MKQLRRSLPVALIVLILVSVFTFQANIFAFDNNITISKVTVTFYSDPLTAKGFTWYTPAASTASDLQVVEGTGQVADFSKAVKFSGHSFPAANSWSENVHKAEAAGLKADTSYFFRVGDAEAGVWSETGTFRTAPKSGAFTFIDLTDTQAESEKEAAISARTIAKACSTVGDARFMVMGGDFVERGNNEQLWNWLFNFSESNLLNTTLVPVAGNHDYADNCFIDHFNVKPAPTANPVHGAYYSFNYSNGHFIILNSNDKSDEYATVSPAQVQWLRDDVKAARAVGAEWMIACIHKGPYTTAIHAIDQEIIGSNGLRTKLAPIMSGLGIDLVLQGHDHIYARSKPIKDGKVAAAAKQNETFAGATVAYSVKPDGTIYLIPNTAGPKVYSRNDQLGSSYFNLFEVADEQHAAVYGGRGQVQNFVGITIEGAKLTGVSYEIDQHKNNGAPYVIDRFGIVK